MIKNFKVENFYSIADEQILNFEINSKDVLNESAVQIGDTYLNTVNCVIGHNASGKTNIMKAITFLFWFVNSSYTKFKEDKFIPIQQHALKKDAPSRIVIEFLNDEQCYKYEISFNKKEVIFERLESKHEVKGGRYSLVFEAQREESKKTFKSNHFKVNQADEERFLGRRNVPILSALIDTGYLPKLDFFNKYESNVSKYGVIVQVNNPEHISKVLYKNDVLRNQVLSILKEIDIGVSDFSFADVSISEKGTTDVRKVKLLEFIHKTENGSFKLPIFQQSNGTQNALGLIVEAIRILSSGGVFIVDEIEAQLHPFVVKKIISIFERYATNTKNAQIIFSTHQHLLLNERTKTQIFLAEKQSETLSTDLYRLDDVDGVRNDENFANKYLSGAYGAIAKNIWL